MPRPKTKDTRLFFKVKQSDKTKWQQEAAELGMNFTAWLTAKLNSRIELLSTNDDLTKEIATELDYICSENDCYTDKAVELLNRVHNNYIVEILD